MSHLSILANLTSELLDDVISISSTEDDDSNMQQWVKMEEEEDDGSDVQIF